MQTENQSQVIICVAPSGGRRSYKDHPNIPLTPTELSETAVESLDAGASVFHLHVRDHNLRHVLDVSASRLQSKLSICGLEKILSFKLQQSLVAYISLSNKLKW